MSSDVQVNGLEPVSDEEQQKAAAKIQAGIRGYRDRQRVKALRFVCLSATTASKSVSKQFI